MGALWVSGVLGGPAYSRDVARPMAEVVQGLSDLDLTKQPGAPATDPERSGGVPNLFRLEQQGNELHWVVTSGDKVAMTMIAALTPIDATHTKVTARVERGDAPDDFVAPAFRSKGVTMGLFAIALEDELNDLTKPPQRGVEECAAIFEKLMRANFGEFPQPEPETLSGAIAKGARTSMKLAAVQAEARRQGCEPRSFDDSAPMQPQMKMPAGGMSDSGSPGAPGPHENEISFKPGQPMVRATPVGSRP